MKSKTISLDRTILSDYLKKNGLDIKDFEVNRKRKSSRHLIYIQVPSEDELAIFDDFRSGQIDLSETHEKIFAMSGRPYKGTCNYHFLYGRLLACAMQRLDGVK